MRLFAIIISMIFFMQSVSAAPFNAKAKTKRIPAGTQFQLQLLEPISSYAASSGSEFSAILITDQTADSDVILPMGSLVRGTVKRVESPKRFSKSAVLFLDFDHVVTPNGRQLPLSMAVVGRNDITYDGGISGGTKDYKDALSQNWKTMKNITKTCTEWGGDVFDNVIVADQLMTGVGAVGGAIGGTSYYVYDFFADMIKKGKQVNIHKGEVLNVILTEPIDVPVI